MSVTATRLVRHEQLLAQYPEQVCPAGDGVVSWREAGSGPAIVLLHGISSGAASWVEQLAGLQTRARVLAWNAPGYGGSTALATPTPYASDYARVLGEWLDAVAVETATVVGHSLGALMAAAFASAHPQRVRRLVLLSPARGYANADPAERERRYADRIAKLERLGPEGIARERAAALLSPNAASEAVAWVAWNMRRLHPGGYRQAAWMLANDDIDRYATGYAGAVTVISGSADAVTPPARCEAVARQFKHATYAQVPGLGHALYLEDAARSNEILRQLTAQTVKDF